MLTERHYFNSCVQSLCHFGLSLCYFGLSLCHLILSVSGFNQWICGLDFLSIITIFGRIFIISGISHPVGLAIKCELETDAYTSLIVHSKINCNVHQLVQCARFVFQIRGGIQKGREETQERCQNIGLVWPLFDLSKSVN